MRYRLRPRLGRIWQKGRGERFLAPVIGLGLALLLVSTLNEQFKPVLTTLATAQAENAVNALINTAVEDTLSAEGISYGDLFEFEKNDQGQIVAYKGDTRQITMIQTALTDRVLGALDGVEVAELSVPLGNLSGVTLLSGVGPSLTVRVVSTGSSQTAFHNEFVSAGINQTLHRVMLEVTADLAILLPGETVETQTVCQICLSETVIVGQVPESYLQLGAE